MNRLLLRFSLPVLAAVAVVSSAWQQAAKPVGREATITGPVVDLACYFNKGDSGPKHVPCAEMCAKAGVPFGILGTDGKLYLPAKHGESANAGLMQFLEQQVTATGKVYPAGGANTIEIETIAKKS
jgi:hypothetical protein